MIKSLRLRIVGKEIQILVCQNVSKQPWTAIRYPKLLSQFRGTPNKWQPWLHSQALSILASQICLNMKYMRMLDKIISDMMSDVWSQHSLTLCLWLLHAYRMSQEAHVWERIGCGCLRRSYTCRICDVQRFKLSYPITFAIIQPLDVWGGSTSSRKTCIRLRDTSDTSATEAIHGATSQSQPSTSRIVELHRFLS